MPYPARSAAMIVRWNIDERNRVNGSANLHPIYNADEQVPAPGESDAEEMSDVSTHLPIPAQRYNVHRARRTQCSTIVSQL